MELSPENLRRLWIFPINDIRTCNIHGYENLNWFGDPGKHGVLLKLGEDVSEFQFIQTYQHD